MRDPIPGEFCRHYKGGIYIILAEAIHTEDLIRIVVYRKLNEEQTWARPMENFCGDVITEGFTVERFSRISSCACKGREL